MAEENPLGEEVIDDVPADGSVSADETLTAVNAEADTSSMLTRAAASDAPQVALG